MIQCHELHKINWQKPEFEIGKNRIHVWVVHPAGITSDDLNLLDDEEQKRAKRFVQEKDRLAFVTSHVALRKILSGYLGCSPEEVVTGKSKNRKPFIAYPLTNLRFNLSHSGMQTVVSVSELETGVDVELVNRKVNYEDVVRSYFSNGEREFIEKSKQPLMSFFRLWTRKEAVLKLTGQGITDSLKKIEVCHDVNPGIREFKCMTLTFAEKNFVCSIAHPLQKVSYRLMIFR